MMTHETLNSPQVQATIDRVTQQLESILDHIPSEEYTCVDNDTTPRCLATDSVAELLDRDQLIGLHYELLGYHDEDMTCLQASRVAEHSQALPQSCQGQSNELHVLIAKQDERIQVKVLYRGQDFKLSD